MGSSDMYRQRHGKEQTTINPIDKSNGPTSKPLENPWSKQYHQRQQQQQRQQSLVGGNNNNYMNMMNMMMGNMNMKGNNNGGNQLAMNENPSQIYVIQLRELRNMGFNDEQRNINALIASGGNVAAAVQYLLEHTPTPNTSNDRDKDNKK